MPCRRNQNSMIALSGFPPCECSTLPRSAIIVSKVGGVCCESIYPGLHAEKDQLLITVSGVFRSTGLLQKHKRVYVHILGTVLADLKVS